MAHMVSIYNVEYKELKKYNFNGLVVHGANNGYPYCFRYYGNDCMTNKKCEYRNESNPLFKSEPKSIISSS